VNGLASAGDAALDDPPQRPKVAIFEVIKVELVAAITEDER